MKKDKVYNNRAGLRSDCSQASDCTDLLCCPEELVFAMKDNYHQFSIGLSTIIQCLAIAERDGHIPKIPADWWNDLRHT